MVSLLATNLAFAIITDTWNASVYHYYELACNADDTIGAFATAGVWIPYFLLLKRVKDTFIE